MGTSQLRSISLFSGCMGLDLGLERAGIFPAAVVEKDEVCQNTIRRNRPGLPIFGDVFSASGGQLCEAAGGSVDAVVGGPPCQSFSTIGKRKSVVDSRGRALLEYIRLVKEIHPRFFVLENVRGLLSAKKDDGYLFPWLLRQFQTMGYTVEHGLLNSRNYGSPQNRIRVVMIGSLEGAVMLPAPMKTRGKTLGDAIRDIEEETPADCARFSPRLAGFLSKIPPGGDWRNLSRRDQDVAMGRANRGSGGLTAFYRRLSYDRPCPTLVTAPTQRGTTLCHPSFIRPLSVEEYRRIQGVPPSWELSGSTTHKYRQLGNAVPCELAEAVGRAVREAAR